jgi:hypothetical protein
MTKAVNTDQLLVNALKNELSRYEKSIIVLSESYDKCLPFISYKTFSREELEAIDALTSRFARASDILIQKIFGLIDALELEERGSTLDRINRSEKRGIISSAAIFREIRQLRNLISHEYTEEEFPELFHKILQTCPHLIKAKETVENYSKQFFIHQ